MNEHLLKIHPHPSKRISDLVASDPEVINLTVGEPSYGPPLRFLAKIRDMVTQPGGEPAPAFNRYAHSRGVLALRQAIAAYYHRLYGIKLDPQTQIIVTNGAAEAIWLTIFALTNSGDDVIIPDPCYMLYEPITISLGRRAIRVAGKPENAFCLSVHDLEQAVTARTRLLILNSPENPTGAIYERTALENITKFAADRGIHVMHDEVFDCMVYEGRHTPAIAFDLAVSNVVMVNSFSKRFGMTGWRLGWMIAPADITNQVVKAHTYSTLATATPIQEAAAETLNSDDVCMSLAEHREALRHRGQRFQQALSSMGGFAFLGGTVQGGFYLFPEVRQVAQAAGLAASATGSISEVIADHLLKTCKVAVVPGSGFGRSGDGFVRLSFAASDEAIDEAINRFRTRL